MPPEAPKDLARWTPLVLVGAVVLLGFFAWVLVSNFTVEGSPYQLLLGVVGVIGTVAYVVYWFRDVVRR